MNTQTDSELLRLYAERRVELAFAELVRRYLDFVYSAAFRMVRDAHLAEDVTQGVFVALVKSAHHLINRATLAGWLHQTAQNIAAQTVRTIERRRAREQEAIDMNQLIASQSDSSWEQIAPHLDAALGELSEPDRDAVLLRYFRNHDYRTLGVTLGISDDAAQKRVSRAVEQMREFFAERGLSVGAGGIAVMISASAAQAAPIGLATAISAAAVLTGTTVSTSTIITATKTIAMTTLQKAVISGAFVAAACAAVFEARQAAQLHGRNQVLQQQQAPLAAQIRQLQRERDDATNRLAGLLAENARIKSNPNQNELLKLRGEVTRLRNDAELANDPVVKKALQWKANAERLKLLFAEHPEQRVPEMRLISDDQFFDVARDQDLESSNGIRRAFSETRHVAKNDFAPMLQQALKAYVAASGGELPSNVSGLKPYFEKSVDDAMLDQYKLLFTGKMSAVKGNFVLADKQVVDPELDYPWEIGPNAYGPVSSAFETAQMTSQLETLNPAIAAFSAANGGAAPSSLSQIKPFVSTPEQQAVYDKLVKDGVSINPQMTSQLETLNPAIAAFSAANGGAAPSSLSQIKPFISTPEQQAVYDKLVKDGVSINP